MSKGAHSAYGRLSNIVSMAVGMAALLTYVLTVEPAASFWTARSISRKRGSWR